MMTVPLVSVTSAFYNASPFLLDMIKSIFAQTFTDLELILLDDGSTDNSLQIAQSINDPRVKVFTNGRNLGIPTSLNKITQLARGKYIARMDADDMSGIMRIQKQVEFMESHPDIDVVGCGVFYLDENDNPVGRRLALPSHAEICRAPSRVYGMAHPTIFTKKSWLEKNKYDETIPRSSDYNLFLRTYQTSRYANIPEPLFYYRCASSFRLKNVLIASRKKAKFISEYHAGQRHYAKAVFCFIRTYAKLAVKTGVCIMGAKDKLLARRYQPLTEEQENFCRQEIKKIKNIWQTK